MSLFNCPECGHENSDIAVACANCGRPIHTPVPVVERRVVVTEPRESGVPPWAFVAMGVVAIMVIGLLFFMVRNNSEQGNTNINVNTAGKRTAVTEPARSSEPQPANVPAQTTTVPGTSTSVPNAPLPDKGTVIINAKVAPVNGSPQPARVTRFYLLDQDVEMILSEARVEPIEGNTLAGSLGLAAVYPERYGEFQRAAMRAIGAHAKYSGTTSGTGAANLAGVAPNEYYLFAVSRVGRGFALCNQPVSVVAGDNIMNLSPQSVTEISATSE
ncbi:MAG: zinc ribbon domain-containing protein [Chloracidobacterium sp.]|nr:zinc ribbon domain-containing protein [Chloracidobacterium sp.]